MLTIYEIIDLTIISIVVGFIFKDMFKKPAPENYDPLASLNKGFDFENLKFAILVSAPAIVLHELGHKFVAMGFGLHATVKAWYFGLGLGLVLKLVNAPFIILAPGYAEICKGSMCPVASLPISPLESAITAFAGPFVNLVLWLGSLYIIKHNLAKRKNLPFLILTSRINMILFIFNMLPFGPLDGAKVFKGLFSFITSL